MILGNKKFINSPVKQDFVWIAENVDGTHISEFDFQTKKPNSFYAIDKSRLLKFGLIGSSSQIYFNVGNGVFFINGHKFMVSYTANDKEYPLTGRAMIYNDIITYKDAVSDVVPSLREAKPFVNTITQFNVGYKKKMELDGVNIMFQNLISLPINNPALMQIKITSDTDLDGKLVIRRNGEIVDEIHAPLKSGLAGMINWKLR